MKRPFIYFLSALTILLGTSCEDAIEMDLGTPVRQVVIDAVINQTNDTQFIYVSKSNPFLSNNAYEGYQLDSIGILDTSSMKFYNFTHKGNGVYYFVPDAGGNFRYGNTYQLIARDGSNTYVSQSKLESPVTIDSFTYSLKEKGTFGGGKGNYVTLWAKDKPGTGDHYWFRLYRNDSLQSKASDIILAIDNSVTESDAGDGDLFIVPIRENFNSRPYQTGESARVEVLTIPQELYYYLNLINTQLTNQGLFAVPSSNVPSNIVCLNDSKIKILGFFALTGKVSTQKIVFP